MKYINIVTKLPHFKDLELLKNLNKYEAHSMQGQIPVVWDKAKDFLVWDRHGNQFMDFTSGICVANCGHGNRDVMNAIRKKINRPLAHSYTFGTEVRYNFIKELVETCYPKGKAFLVSAGTEATEVACKLMRSYGLKEGRNIIYSVKGAMHGRTLLAERLKGINEDNKWATNWSEEYPEFDHLHPFEKSFQEEFRNDIKYRGIAGIIIESYQGWSASFYPKQYIQDLVKFAKDNNILVCFDEIQGGFGRTGKMFAYEHYDIDRPDLICLGKGISSSVPLSGVIGRKDIIDCVDVGSMSSTHSANPIACSAGLANLKYLKKHKLIERSEKLGNQMINFLRDYLKLNIEGHGLLCAIHTKTEKEADKIVMECFKKGLLLIRTHKTSVKIAPPLTITDEALTEGLEIIASVMKEK
jgi:4-aminobutyrate aminotransferase-like enzyme